MTVQTIATTIEVGYSDGPAGTTAGVGRAVAGAHYLMEVEANHVGLDLHSGRSTYYIGVVSDVTFPPNTVARTNSEWREHTVAAWSAPKSMSAACRSKPRAS
jgi:hypothetical protein